MLGNISTIIIILLIYNKNKKNLSIKIDYYNLNIPFLFFIIPLSISSQIIGSEIENLISIFFKRSLNFYEAIITLAKLPGIFGFLLAIILIAVLPAILEELLFRGIIQQGLINKYSVPTGIILTSFLFAIVHINPHVLLTIFLLSILLGSVYHLYKNIIYNISIHFLLNLTGLFLIRYDKFQMKGLNTDLSISSHVNIYLTFISLVIIGLIVYFYLIKYNKQKIKKEFKEE